MKKMIAILLCFILVSCGQEKAERDNQANIQSEQTKAEQEHFKKKLELPEDDEDGKTF